MILWKNFNHKVERALTDEIAVSLWKMATAERWVLEELYSRRNAATAILDVFINSSDSAGNPFSKQEKKVRNAARAGWDCRELIVKVGGNDEPSSMELSFSSQEKKKSRLQFEAKLGDSADTILRYQTTWKRDLYRAIESLRNLQRTRTAAEGPSPITGYYNDVFSKQSQEVLSIQSRTNKITTAEPHTCIRVQYLAHQLEELAATGIQQEQPTSVRTSASIWLN